MTTKAKTAQLLYVYVKITLLNWHESEKSCCRNLKELGPELINITIYSDKNDPAVCFERV